MVEGAGAGDVKEEYIRRVSYADHTCSIGRDGTVVYGDREFDGPVTPPFIHIPYLDGVVVVPAISTDGTKGRVEHPTRALRVPSRAVYRQILLFISAPS